MHDPFVGTWTLNPAKSQFDPNHKPREASMRWQLEADGGYLMLAEGVDQKGERVAEKPQKLFADGRICAVENFPGLKCITTRPEPRTIHAQVTREDGSIAGEGSYVVAADGRSMTATTAGFDSQLRRFEMKTIWNKA